MSVIKVLYLFAGERKKLEKSWKEGAMPDSFFIGLNHLKEFGIEASYIENKFLNWVRKKNYNLPNLFLIFAIRSYDIVFSGASLSLPFVAKVLFRMKKPKFFWYNTFFTNAIRRNERKPFRLWAIKKTIRSLDAVFCPSTAQRQFLIEQGFDPARIFFIQNGIDVAFMKRKQEEGKGAPSLHSELRRGELKSAEPFILAVGKDMGRDYATLSEAVRDLPIKVKVAALPRNFKGVKEVPKNLEILGFVPFNDLIKLYSEAEFVVIPTKSEKHPDASDCSGQYVLLDAMSLGKAVIASRRGTLADYLDDGENGVVVPPEDPKALRAAIVSLLNDKGWAEVMGKRAAAKAGNFFTTRRLAGELAKVFKGLLT